VDIKAQLHETKNKVQDPI